MMNWKILLTIWNMYRNPNKILRNQPRDGTKSQPLPLFELTQIGYIGIKQPTDRPLFELTQIGNKN
jgi:hypothetical protein